MQDLGVKLQGYPNREDCLGISLLGGIFINPKEEGDLYFLSAVYIENKQYRSRIQYYG